MAMLLWFFGDAYSLKGFSAWSFVFKYCVGKNWTL